MALPTDPLNTSQKLVISFPSVLICLKDNKLQAVFVLSGLWFRMWQPYSLQLKYWILGLNTVSPENSPALCCPGVEHAVIIVTTIHNYLIRNTPLPACIYSQTLRNGLDFRDSIRGQNILRIFSFFPTKMQSMFITGHMMIQSHCLAITTIIKYCIFFWNCSYEYIPILNLLLEITTIIKYCISLWNCFCEYIPILNLLLLLQNWD